LNLQKRVHDAVVGTGLPPQTVYAAVGGAAILSASLLAYKNLGTHEKHVKFSQYEPISEPYFDVAIVGAGPSGSSLGWYLSKGNPNLKVLLLEKKQFPRDKYCGDAVSWTAQKHLRRMGVLQEIVAEKKGQFSHSGGFVSPKGNSFVGDSSKELDLGDEGLMIAIKRIWLDEKIAAAAKAAGALLTENTTVDDAVFIKEKGVWKISCTLADDSKLTYYARCLICADGAPSRLARQLGIVQGEPQGTCSRSYVKNNNLFKFDGVIFYPPQLLPGYCAIFREAQGELNFCTYIIPGGPTQNEDLYQIHHSIMKDYPQVATSLGPNPDIEQMRAASLRLGGVPKSYADHLLVIGDAAGFIDPLTGEGIQYALESGEFAAQTLLEAFAKQDLSAAQLRQYQSTWKKHWGAEFYWSMKMSLFLYRFPIILDAVAKLIEKRGHRFMSEWAQVMTGQKQKTWFLRLDVWPFILLEVFAQAARNLTGK
jgi:geranylgeranyl reductase family protein